LTVLLIGSATQAVSGWGLYRLRPWSRPLAVGCATFCLLAAVLSLTMHMIAFHVQGRVVAVIPLAGLGTVGLLSRLIQPGFALWTLAMPNVAALFHVEDATVAGGVSVAIPESNGPSQQS